MSFPHIVRRGARIRARSTGRRTRWYLGVAVLLLLSSGALFLFLAMKARQPADSGTRAPTSTPDNLPAAQLSEFIPPFQADTFEGKRFAIADYEDKTAVIIDFWASWCSFCEEEIPLLQQMAEVYGKEALTMVGIHRGDTESAERGIALAAKLGITYTLLQDPEGKLFMLLSQGRPFMPLTIFVDREGRVVERRIGPKTAEEIRVSTAKIINDNAKSKSQNPK
ncbi:MAG: TlpA disulfide reductase family protein [Patescibacteria group bacterium]